MKKKLLVLVVALCGCLNIYSQATSLTIDNQTPGQLSSLINYDDQQTLENIKVTGYINNADINFIKSLNVNHSLSGIIDLEDVKTVMGGSIPKDNTLPNSFFKSSKYIRKFIYPKSLISEPFWPFRDSERIDSVIWTSTIVKSLNVTHGIKAGECGYVFIPEGVEEILSIPNNIHITIPNTLKKVNDGNVCKKVTVYSFIDNPETIHSQYEYYYNSLNGEHRSYWSAFDDCTFYIPKGTKDKYMNSDFATLKIITDEYREHSSTPNNNTFIEFFDIDSTIVVSPINLYEGDMTIIKHTIYPSDDLVSWIDYVTKDTSIVNVDYSGNVKAKKYGNAVISVTPHIFIPDLTTKTGSCTINVYAHTEGVKMHPNINVHINEEKSLNAQTLPIGVSDNKLIFKSSNKEIAKVSTNGIVRGVKCGTCTITATSIDGGFTTECVVTVTQPVEVITLEKHRITLKTGETERLFIQISPTIADNKTIIWSSSDEQIATVDGNGKVMALKSGEVWIKAVSQDNTEAKDSCIVTVIQPVIGIQLDNKTYQLNGIGDSFKLNATIIPDDASNKNIKWSSSNESICVVSHGQVVSVGYGTCVIVANTEDGGYIATCVVTNYPLGDVNRDGIVNISDVISVVNHILGQTPSGFLIGAADVNRDGKVDIVDATCIIDILLNSTLN